jgi:hypothetical protein
MLFLSACATSFVKFDIKFAVLTEDLSPVEGDFERRAMGL